MIKLENLVFKYPSSDTNALDGINLTFEKGKFIAILGHNGSGKSTLSKVLAGLYKPYSGNLIIDGEKVVSKKDLWVIRKNIGIIFQNPDNQFIGATVEDDIAFGLENKQISRPEMQKIVKDLAAKVSMENFLDREPATLSGGQKQKIAIASTLALNPSIVIFDEVTSMLDPKGKTEVIKIIKEIQQNKEQTLISITHDMDEAILADKVIVLAKGKVVAVGSPKDILNNDKILKIAKIDSPFIYKVSKAIKGIEPTYNEQELLELICK